MDHIRPQCANRSKPSRGGDSEQNVSNAAQQAGISEQQLLTQLAQAFPALVNKLSSNGQLPNPQQLAAVI